MKTYQTKDRQTLFDVALRCCGSVEKTFELALLNDLQLTDEPTIGTQLQLPSPSDDGIVEYWTTNGIYSATAIEKTIIIDTENNTETEVSFEGIGYWSVGGTFIVS